MVFLERAMDMRWYIANKVKIIWYPRKVNGNKKKKTNVECKNSPKTREKVQFSYRFIYY